MGKRVIGFVGVGVSLLAGTMMIGACGSDEDRLTTEEFLKQGNAICATFDQAMEEANAEMSANPELGPSEDEIGAYIEDAFAPNLQVAIDDLEELNPPQELEDDVDTFLAYSQTALDEVVDAAASDLESASLGMNSFADFDAQATEIGLTSCTQAGQAEDFLTAAGAACSRAHQMALYDADRLGYGNHQLTPDEQAEYYEGRAGQVEDLIVALSALEPSPDFSEGWATTLGYLEEYGAWASTNVTTINASNSTVNEGSPSSLQSFRAVFELGYGHPCQDLFDMN